MVAVSMTTTLFALAESEKVPAPPTLPENWIRPGPPVWVAIASTVTEGRPPVWPKLSVTVALYPSGSGTPNPSAPLDCTLPTGGDTVAFSLNSTARTGRPPELSGNVRPHSCGPWSRPPVRTTPLRLIVPEAPVIV